MIVHGQVDVKVSTPQAWVQISGMEVRCKARLSLPLCCLLVRWLSPLGTPLSRFVLRVTLCHIACSTVPRTAIGNTPRKHQKTRNQSTKKDAPAYTKTGLRIVYGFRVCRLLMLLYLYVQRFSGFSY